MNDNDITVNISIVIIYVIAVCLLVLLIWLMLFINRRFFSSIQKKQQGLHLKFFQRVSSAIIIFGGALLGLSLIGGVDNVWQSLLGGTAVVTAVLSFAAQDIVKDILAGLMISIYKPIEIGNRVELEDGTAGIVKDITMRHVVLQGMDTTYIIIPNSKLNSMKLVNLSFNSKLRAAAFTFRIAYDADVEKAKEVIKEAVIASDISVPGLPVKGSDELVYADVYFKAIEVGSLKLETTVYYESGTRSEVLISDINTRVNEAFRVNGIDKPYMYVNIIEGQEERTLPVIKAEESATDIERETRQTARKKRNR